MDVASNDIEVTLNLTVTWAPDVYYVSGTNKINANSADDLVAEECSSNKPLTLFEFFIRKDIQHHFIVLGKLIHKAFRVQVWIVPHQFACQ